MFYDKNHIMQEGLIYYIYSIYIYISIYDWIGNRECWNSPKDKTLDPPQAQLKIRRWLNCLEGCWEREGPGTRGEDFALSGSCILLSWPEFPLVSITKSNTKLGHNQTANVYKEMKENNNYCKYLNGVYYKFKHHSNVQRYFIFDSKTNKLIIIKFTVVA